MTAPMLRRSIANQFRKAMKRRRERQRAREDRQARAFERFMAEWQGGNEMVVMKGRGQ